MSIMMAHHDGVDLAYETVGEPVGEPILLIMGMAAQMIVWPDDFCTALSARGFHVVRFDNRDSGLSTHLTEAGVPGWRALRKGTGAPYSLGDMAGDTLAVMDSLGWASAHLAGVSMGAMIAQILAARHPDRVRTLTSFMGTPSTHIGHFNPRLFLRMALLGRRLGRPTNADETGRNMVEFARLTGSPGYRLDEERYRELGRRSYERDPNPEAGGHRQNVAVRASGDRRAELAHVRAPTLVIHGENDIAIRPVGGRATADAIPGARLVTYPGMGHELPRPLWPAFIDEIRALADGAATTSTTDPAAAATTT